MDVILLNIKFLTKVQENFESRGLKNMLRSGSVNTTTVDKSFTYACRNDRLRVANVLLEYDPTRYWFDTNDVGHINKYSISKPVI